MCFRGSVILSLLKPKKNVWSWWNIHLSFVITSLEWEQMRFLRKKDKGSRNRLMDGGICSRIMKAAQSKKWDSSSEQSVTCQNKSKEEILHLMKKWPFHTLVNVI